MSPPGLLCLSSSMALGLPWWQTVSALVQSWSVVGDFGVCNGDACSCQKVDITERSVPCGGTRVSEKPPVRGIFHDPLSLLEFCFLTVAETHFPRMSPGCSTGEPGWGSQLGPTPFPPTREHMRPASPTRCGTQPRQTGGPREGNRDRF